MNSSKKWHKWTTWTIFLSLLFLFVQLELVSKPKCKVHVSCHNSQKSFAGHRKHVAHLRINWNLTSKADYVFGIALIFGKIIYIDLLQT